MVATTANANPIGDIFSSILSAFLAFIISFTILLLPFFYLSGMRDIEAAYYTVINNFYGVSKPIYLNVNYLNEYVLFVQVASALISFYIAYLVYKSTAPEREIQLEGRKLLEGEKAVQQWYKAMDKEEKWGEEGILICQTPDGEKLTISQDRETKHTILIGGTGSGKTTILRPRIDAARERGDRVLIYDNKSDFTATLPNAKDIILIAPWDSRGWAWDIATDCRNRSDAEAFADAVITANDKDPMWSNAARAILSAIIIRCQNQLPKRWGFSHIFKIIEGDAEVQSTVKTFCPENFSLVKDMQSKTTASILVTLKSFLRPISAFATAWDDCKVPNKFSIKNWLHGKGIEADKRTIIVQGNGEVETVQIALTQALISAIKREVTSPRFTDVRPSERRINLFLDEFKQLGKLEGFSTLLEVGRSKGIRLTIALQDIHQLYEVYGREVANTWLSGFGTFIIGAVKGTETTKYLTEMIGRKRIKVYSPSYSDGTRSDTYQEQDRAVISSDKFARKLGANENGVRLILFTGDDYAYIIDAKHLTSEQQNQKRKPTKPAAWLNPDFSTAFDVAVANQVRKEADYVINQ